MYLLTFYLFSDALSSVGLVIGLFVIYFTKIYWIDYVLTICFGAFITYAGFRLVRESITNLLDKADQLKLDQLVRVLNINRHPKWIEIHNLRVASFPHVVFTHIPREKNKDADRLANVAMDRGY